MVKNTPAVVPGVAIRLVRQIGTLTSPGRDDIILDACSATFRGEAVRMVLIRPQLTVVRPDAAPH